MLVKVLIKKKRYQEECTYQKELEKEFRDENSEFKIVIVVDMWLTGLDVPGLDSMYIDKPL